MSFEDVSPFVNLWGLAIVAFMLIKQQMKMSDTFIGELKKISADVKRMADNLNKTELSVDKAIMIFEAIMSEHISKKIDFISSVFEANNLSTRQEQIKKNLRSAVYEITQKEISKLSEFTLPNGYCLSAPLSGFDLDKFLLDLYPMIFAKDDNLKKLWDIKSFMCWCVNELRNMIMNSDKYL